MPQSTRSWSSSRTDLPLDDQDGPAFPGHLNGTLTVNGGGPIRTVTSPAPPPSFSNDQIVQWLRTQWAGFTEGTTRSWSGPTVTYLVGGTPYASGSPETASTVDMTALMRSRAALAFELWDDLISIDLTPAKTASYGQIQFEYASDTDSGGTYSAAWTSYAGTSPYDTDAYSITRNEIWINSDWATQDANEDMYFGGYGFETYLHEIGHSLGLSHPGSYNEGQGGFLSYWTHAEFSDDNRLNTVMSYFGGYQPGAGWQQDGTSPDWLFPSTPMLYDVLAIQAMYGADYTTRATDTVYGFNSTAGRDIYDFTKNTRPIVTIWDGGGIDTLDASGFRADQTIYLYEGSYSYLGGRFPVGIAWGALIENAVGGSGNDRITGNLADNRLTGGAGDDTLQGDAGIDSAIFSGASSQYAVTLLADNTVQVAGPDGIDELWYVEKLVFSDRTVASPSWKSVSISNATITEGNKGAKVATFTVTSTGSAAPFDVMYGTRDGTATASDGDYVSTSGFLSFAAGDDSRTISVTINGDTTNEIDESFQVDLYSASQGVTISEISGIGTITDDDILAGTVSITDVLSVDEGAGLATFTVTRSGGLSPFSVNYATANGTARVADGDYVATSGTLFFGAGVSSQTISVAIIDDTDVEADETYRVDLSKATNGAKIGNGRAIGTIYSNDDGPGLVAISDATITEGDNGTKVATFTVTRTGGIAPFSVHYASADGTATVADGDYVATSGKLSFGVGVDSQTISVTIKGDTKVEADETFKLNLSHATQYANISDADAIATITNDDLPPGTVAISDVTVAEGNSGTKVAIFTVTRTGGTTPFSVNYATADGTAKIADGDYLAASGVLSFGAGVESRTIAVTINGNTMFEADETFRVNLSGATNGATIGDAKAIGTIANDDILAGRVAISNATIAEGSSGRKVATFTVTRTGGTAPFSVNYATADGTAKVADGDYLAASGTLSFGTGVESRTISVKINGDGRFEADEIFRVNLSDATNGATIGDAKAIGTITNDDTPPGTVAISDAAIVEGNGGRKVATFTVTRTGGTAPFSVNYATADGTAKVADGDYLAASGTLSFGAGVESRTISVKINGDGRFEADETFRVNLSGATNGATIGDAKAIGTIANDDAQAGKVAIADVTIAEGNSGTRVAAFIVTRTGGTAAFSLDYATADLLATASDGDYAAASGTLSFGAGVDSRTISVTVKGDTRFEADETFRVNLSGATNGATIGDVQAIGIIGNDDLSENGKIVIGSVKGDTLKGGSHSDVLYGLDGNDVLIGRSATPNGFNQLNGGSGIDTASYAGTALDVSADLALRLGSVNGVLTDRMDSIENLSGGAGNDTLLGDDNANVLAGGAGSDRLSGRGGADVFVYNAWSESTLAAGYDTIADFVSGTDKIDLTALHTSASHVAFVSINASTMIQVGKNAGMFDPATDLALTVNTSAIGIDDFRF